MAQGVHYVCLYKVTGLSSKYLEKLPEQQNWI